MSQVKERPAGGLIPAAKMQELRNIDVARREATSALAAAKAAGDDMTHALVMANAIQHIRGLLTDALMKDVMALADNRLGFLTDKRPGDDPYPVPVVRDAVIQALLSGFRVVGNEFNVIAGNFYGTVAGYERLLNEWPGLSNFRVDMGVPITSQSGKGALVPAIATWKLHGVADSLECSGEDRGEIDTRIPVRVNAGMGLDAILGKARRKMYAMVVRRLTGVKSVDTDDGTTIDAPAPEPPAPETIVEPERPGPDADQSFDVADAIVQNLRGKLEAAKSVRKARDFGADAIDVLRESNADGETYNSAADEIERLVEARVAQLQA